MGRRRKRLPVTALDSTVPQLIEQLLIAALPALVAAVFAAANAAMAALPGARKATLRSALRGKSRAALDRYLSHGDAIEARWLLVRALGIGASALLFGRALPDALGGWRLVVAALCALLAYALPTEAGTAIAERSAHRAAPLLLRLLRPVELLVAPIATPLTWVGALIGRSVAADKTLSAEMTESEVEHLVTEGEQQGTLAHDQSEMIRNVLDFGDLTTGDVMVPRTRVQAFELRTPGKDLLQRALEAGHSRFPVYRESIDNVVGQLHVKDLLAYVATHDLSALRLEELMRKPVVFVPERQSASSVLRDMRAGRQHLAIVIDEFGGVSGIVTMEDLLEEIVGDIRDEYDVDEAPIVDLGDGRLLVDAAIPILDLSRYLGTELPEHSEYNSLGGFIVTRLGRVPGVGATLEEDDLQFIVREADDRRVAKVEIVLSTPPPESVAGPSSRAPAA